MSGFNDIAKALALGADLLSLVRQGLAASNEINKIAAKAAAEGRTELTPQEWATVLGDAQAARDRLAEALARKQ